MNNLSRVRNRCRAPVSSIFEFKILVEIIFALIFYSSCYALEMLQVSINAGSWNCFFRFMIDWFLSFINATLTSYNLFSETTKIETNRFDS